MAFKSLIIGQCSLRSNNVDHTPNAEISQEVVVLKDNESLPVLDRKSGYY